MGRIKDLPARMDTTLTSKEYFVVDNEYGTFKQSSGRKVGSKIGNDSYTEGLDVEATGDISHAEGYLTVASGMAAHAGGTESTAKNSNSFAQGKNVKTTNGVEGMAAFGQGNVDAPDNIFEVGSMISEVQANAFSVDKSGLCKAATSFQSEAADYAEYFEWSDGNTQNEDRVGRFVTFDDGKKIRLANADDSYILGVVSGSPCVIGNGDCDVWTGMIKRDAFGRPIYEETPVKESIMVLVGTEIQLKEEDSYDEHGNPIMEKVPVLNPEYDPTRTYIRRSERPEWDPIGMLGVLAVCDDGTCQVNGYASIKDGGIATGRHSDIAGRSYRVIERVSKNVVKIVFR